MMTRRQVAAARRETFAAAPFRVYVLGSVRTFATRDGAVSFAETSGGVAWRGTAAEMADGSAERLTSSAS